MAEPPEVGWWMASFFRRAFASLTGHQPFRWQERLYGRFVEGDIPRFLDLPTGLGKTSVMSIWLIARARNPALPRRLVYVVDRRAVVDQATSEAEKIRCRLGQGELAPLVEALGLGPSIQLPVSTLRGQFVDNRLWLRNPTMPAIIVGTIDMTGSRLLFSGYGVSPRMRPYHAGFLGADSLVVLDEAHLCPPFEALLRVVSENGSDAFGPVGAVDRSVVPPFRLLSLSATGRDVSTRTRNSVFQLMPEDGDDCIVRRRLAAPKRLTLENLEDAGALAPRLVERACTLATEDGPSRVLIYCNSPRDAVTVKAGIDKQFGKVAHASELLVGARRVHERQNLHDWLEAQGFVGGTEERPDRPAFLIATSAGEVGVDLDADHMVCDLVEWERMVQRLGRVNRRGHGQARIEVAAAPRVRKLKEDWAKRLARLRAPLDALPPAESNLDVVGAAEPGGAACQAKEASPGAIVGLKDRAASDRSLMKALDEATSREPMRPALTRAIVDAWSLTSLEEHTGRPDVHPWLRGWEEEEEPQTTIAWRRWLPWREDLPEPNSDDVDRFFAAARIHLEETLETETHLAFSELTLRAGSALTSADERQALDTMPALVVLGRDGKLLGGMRLAQLAGLAKAKGNERERAIADMIGRTLVVNAELGGLKDGMLEAKAAQRPTTLDGGWDEETLKRIGYHVVGPGDAEPDAGTWKLAETVWLAPPESSEGGEGKCLRVFVARDAGATLRGDLAIARTAQELAEHHAWVAEEAERIATALRLTQPYLDMLVSAARHHDAGKSRRLWQAAMNAPRDGCIYAKTTGGGDGRRLNGYRHEFGSLRDAEAAETLANLDEDLRDLALHLIVAHHGNARPTIMPFDPESPPSEREQRARSAALRFARLQRRWGPWGLAWWESLLRAADQRASARLDQMQERL